MSQNFVLRNFLWLLTISLLASVSIAEAQQPAKVSIIGFLPLAGDPSRPSPLVEAFRQGLRKLGYIEGKNVDIEYRFHAGRLDHLPALVAELVQIKMNVLVVGTQPAIKAAKKSTKYRVTRGH